MAPSSDTWQCAILANLLGDILPRVHVKVPCFLVRILLAGNNALHICITSNSNADILLPGAQTRSENINECEDTSHGLSCRQTDQSRHPLLSRETDLMKGLDSTPLNEISIAFLDSPPDVCFQVTST